MKNSTQRKKISSISTMTIWLFLCFGALLRFRQYLFNRSLWLDESSLALNIINRSFSGLFQRLDHHQGAPIGFLIIEKLLVQFFGNNEYIFRLFPLLCGVISLFLFYRVARYFIDVKAVLIAIVLFAVSSSLIYYSSEVKQFSSDVAIALLLYFMTVYVESKGLTVLRILMFGAIGAISVWLSHSAVFILAGIGVSLILPCFINKEWSKIMQLLTVYLIWASNFFIIYSISLRSLITDNVLLNYWKDGFGPSPGGPFRWLKWFIDSFFNMFFNPGGFWLQGIAALAFITGCVTMLLEKKEKFLLLIIPIFFVLLASMLHKYPFAGRLILFIVPILLLFIAQGAEKIVVTASSNSSFYFGIIFMILLLFHPLKDSIHVFRKPSDVAVEEIKPVISYVRKHWNKGDVLYLYYGSGNAFEYYSQKYGFNKSDYLLGIMSPDDWDKYKEDLDKLRGNKRAWVLISHVCISRGVDEEKLFLYYLNSIGRKLDSFKCEGAAAYLYDFGVGNKK